jgi:Ice-binding-like/VPDSG-CTERM motif
MKIASSPRMALVVAAAIFLHHNATASTIDLGTAANFAILGGQQVTFDPLTTTVTGGDVGVSPGNGSLPTSITGVPANLNQTGGVIHNTDAVAAAAQGALNTAYVAAAGLAPSGGTLLSQLAGQNLSPGVYTFNPGVVLLDGALTLDAHGVAGALFVFQVPSGLTTGSGSSFSLLGGADPCNIIWQVSSSATLGSGSNFDGTILALTSITLADGVTVDGRLLAQNGLVSLIHDTIITDNCQPGEGTGGVGVPDTGSTLLLLSSGLATLFAFSRWVLFHGKASRFLAI